MKNKKRYGEEDDDRGEERVVMCRAPFNPKKEHAESIKLLSYANHKPISKKHKAVVFLHGIGKWYP